MRLNAAILLVRNKYLEEQRGTTKGTTAEKYEQALREYPATMATAIYYWASQFNSTKEPPTEGGG